MYCIALENLLCAYYYYVPLSVTNKLVPFFEFQGFFCIQIYVYIHVRTHAPICTLNDKKVTVGNVVGVNKNSKCFHEIRTFFNLLKNGGTSGNPARVSDDSTSTGSRERAVALFKRGRVMEGGASVLACKCHFKCFRKAVATFNFLTTASWRRR